VGRRTWHRSSSVPMKLPMSAGDMACHVAMQFFIASACVKVAGNPKAAVTRKIECDCDGAGPSRYRLRVDQMACYWLTMCCGPREVFLPC
jgi:hypothetical protein